MINLGNGVIEIENISIESGFTKAAFESSHLYDQVVDSQTYGFTWYFLQPQHIGNDIFGLTLYFNKQDIIEIVNLRLLDNDSYPGWESWSEYDELKKKDSHDIWLLSNIGKPPYIYTWGEISSDYDQRSGSSTIIVRYNNM